jgi:polyphenol oxidase
MVSEAEPLPPPPLPPIPFRPLPWEERFPWVVQGITTRGGQAGEDAAGGTEPTAPFDLGLGSPDAASRVLLRWDGIRALPGVETVVHARQLHGATVRHHRDLPPGILLAPPADGHLTADPGVLLAVTVADCTPVFLLSESPRAVGLLHAGWRGTAGGILETGIRAFQERLGVGPGALHLYLGPAISGPRYEVGPEVHRALGLEDPGGPTPLDLGLVLEERARKAGVLPHRIGRSRSCTLEDPALFSHRGGDRGRQLALLGIRLPDAGPIP